MEQKEALKILEESRRSYDRIAAEFSATRLHLWPEMECVKKYLPKTGAILDIGCGNGRLLEWQEISSLNYTGIDSSENMLQEAQRLHPNNNFLAADALKLPFQDASFDAAISLAVLHHIPSLELRQKFFSEAGRVLKKDGVLIITVWNFWRARWMWQMIKSALLKIISSGRLDFGDVFLPFGQQKKKRYLHALTKRGLEGLALQAGFSVQHIDKLKSADRRRSNIVLVARKN